MMLNSFDLDYISTLRAAAQRRKSNHPNTNDRCRMLGVSPGTIRHQATIMMKKRASLSHDDACHIVLDDIENGR